MVDAIFEGMSDIPDHHELARRIAALEGRISELSGRPARSTEWTTLLAIFGTGIALAVAILPGLGEVRRDVTDLRERAAVLESLLTEHRQQHSPGECAGSAIAHQCVSPA